MCPRRDSNPHPRGNPPILRLTTQIGGKWTAPSFPEAVTSGKVGTRDIKEAASR
jgi:hypothetical protein